MSNNQHIELIARAELSVSIARKQSNHVHKSDYKSAMINWEGVMEHYDSMADLIDKMKYALEETLTKTEK